MLVRSPMTTVSAPGTAANASRPRSLATSVENDLVSLLDQELCGHAAEAV